MGMHKLATTQMPFPYVQMLYALLYGWMFTIGFPLAVLLVYYEKHPKVSLETVSCDIAR